MKFVVGIMLTAFGTFWGAEGAGAHWPGSDAALLVLIPGIAVFALALVNWLGDCGCLACSILATAQPVPWHGLLLAYGAGAAVGSSGLSPGGFALVEIALTAALTAAGMTASAALAAAAGRTPRDDLRCGSPLHHFSAAPGRPDQRCLCDGPLRHDRTANLRSDRHGAS